MSFINNLQRPAFEPIHEIRWMRNPHLMVEYEKHERISTGKRGHGNHQNLQDQPMSSTVNIESRWNHQHWNKIKSIAWNLSKVGYHQNKSKIKSNAVITKSNHQMQKSPNRIIKCRKSPIRENPLGQSPNEETNSVNQLEETTSVKRSEETTSVNQSEKTHSVNQSEGTSVNQSEETSVNQSEETTSVTK